MLVFTNVYHTNYFPFYDTVKNDLNITIDCIFTAAVAQFSSRWP